MSAVDRLIREFTQPRCDSQHRTVGVRCEKEAGHDGYHWHVGTNGTHVWGIRLRGRRP